MSRFRKLVVSDRWLAPIRSGLVICVFFFSLFTPPVFAQQAINVINVYGISDSTVQDGDILISTPDKGLVKATAEYDSRLFGVMQNNPLLVFRGTDNLGLPVAREGVAQVNVTTLGGEIKPGDSITSSEIPGFGQKATLSGYIIGVATTPFGNTDGQKMDYQANKKNIQISYGKVPVALQIQYAGIPTGGSKLLGSFGSALFQGEKDPSRFAQIFRYLAAGLVALAGFTLGFITFSRSVPKGIEAIGRNPLAGKSILLGVVLNIILTMLTAGLGIAAAALILRL